MISLAIANYDRVEMTIESFIQVLGNALVGEIIIQDDFSDVNKYAKLWNLIQGLNTDKVKLYRNVENIGPFLNKYKVVKQCNNEWCILLDCDNIIDNDYIEKVSNLEKDKDTIYCPEVMYKLNKEGVNWTYKEFNTLDIDRTNVKEHIDNSVFSTWLNTGNYFFNRQRYTDVVEQTVLDVRLSTLDSFYFSYLWLLQGYKLKIVPELSYIHRVHDGSYYLNNRKALRSVFDIIKTKIKEL
jgi:hypothetical protein